MLHPGAVEQARDVDLEFAADDEAEPAPLHLASVSRAWVSKRPRDRVHPGEMATPDPR
jgi:hypothetical protein